jgi:hypothetical protein
LEDQERDETIELSSDSSSDDEVDEENMGDEMAALASKVEDLMIPGNYNDPNYLIRCIEFYTFEDLTTVGVP